MSGVLCTFYCVHTILQETNVSSNVVVQAQKMGKTSAHDQYRMPPMKPELRVVRSQPNYDEVPSSFEEFWDTWVPSLPQGRHIRPDDARDWFRSALMSDKGLAWHFKRMSGVGGSDGGAVLAYSMGIDMENEAERDALEGIEPEAHFMDATTLAEQKLMRIPITDFIGYGAIEGTHMEASLRERLRKMLRAEPVQYEVIPRYDLVGNPDDYVHAGGERVLVDYKHTQNRMKPRHAPFGYIVQLHVYSALLSPEPTRRLLCYTDTRKPPYCLDTIEVPYDERIAEALARDVPAFWQGVCNGVVPPRRYAPEPKPISPELAAWMRENEKQLIALNVLGKQVDLLYARTRESIQEALEKSGVAIEDWKGAFVLPRVTKRRKLNEDAALEQLANLGIAEEAFSVVAGFDLQAMSTELAKLGVDPHKFVTYERDVRLMEKLLLDRNIEPAYEDSFSITLAAGKALPEFELSALKNQGADQVNAACEPLAAKVGELIDSAPDRSATARRRQHARDRDQVAAG